MLLLYTPLARQVICVAWMCAPLEIVFFNMCVPLTPFAICELELRIPLRSCTPLAQFARLGGSCRGDYSIEPPILDVELHQPDLFFGRVIADP